jgi:hypothetical protein
MYFESEGNSLTIRPALMESFFASIYLHGGNVTIDTTEPGPEGRYGMIHSPGFSLFLPPDKIWELFTTGECEWVP